MAEAIAQIQRQASGLSQQIRELNEQSEELRKKLQDQSPMVGAAARQLEQYREQIDSGVTLGQDDLDNYKKILDVLNLQGGETGRQYVHSLARIDSAQAPRQMIPRPLLPEEREAALDRGTTKDQLDRAQMLGDHTVLVRPPKAKPGGPERQVDPVPGGIGGPERQVDPVPGGQGGVSPDLEAFGQRRAAEDTAVGLAAATDAQRRKAAQNRATAMSERELQREWKKTNTLLNQQTRELSQAERQLGRFGKRRQSGETLSVGEKGSARNLRERMKDLRDSAAQSQMERDVVETAGAKRGVNVRGTESARVGRLRQAGSAFVAGGGVGGGGLGSLAAGGAMRLLNPLALGALLAGGMVAAGSRQYSQHVQALMGFESLGRLTGQDPNRMLLRSAEDARRFRVFNPEAITQATDVLGRITGSTNPTGALAVAALTGQSPTQEATRVAQASRFLPSLAGADRIPLQLLAEFRGSSATRRESSLSATVAPSGGLSQAEIQRLRDENEVLEIARSHPSTGVEDRAAYEAGIARNMQQLRGSSPSGRLSAEEVHRLREETKVLKIARSHPSTSEEDRAAYEAGIDRNARQLREGGQRRVRGPDFNPLLYGTFADTAVQVFSQSSSNPFVPSSLGGAAAQVREATRMNFPGIDPESHAGIRAAGALVQQVNQFTQPSGDLFGSMQMMGVYGMRGTPAAEDLKQKFGIDISTPLGVERAIARAPQLAQGGFPDVQQAMFDAVKNMMPDPDMRGMALIIERGMDPESAYQLTRPGADRVIGAKPIKGEDQKLLDAADAKTRGSLANPAADKIYNETIRPMINDILLGSAIGDTVGPVIRAKMNDMTEALVDVVGAVLQAEIDVPMRSSGP